MKNIFLYIACFAFLMMGIASCGDNTDFSVLHTLTPDEIAELNRQDSIREANKEKIDAHLKLEYSVDIMISQTLYDGAKLTIDLDQIASLFGITVEQLLAGIEGESGAPEIKGFAINNVPRADVGSAANTNSPWGHWWDKDGNVTTWGADAMTFAEFDTEAGVFNIGQYPGHLTAGQTVRFIECLKYNEKRVAVIVTITAKERGKITAPVVNTQKLSVNVVPKSGDDAYELTPLKFNLAQTLTDLNITSMNDVTFLGVKEDGSYEQETATPNGFWYDKNGFVGSWGENASVYTAYGEEEELDADCVGIGQMPNGVTEGSTYVIKYAFLANNKIEMLEITVKAVGYEDPETPPAGNPETVTKTVTLTKAYTDDYATIKFDEAKEDLKKAFKMTTYQIHKAIESKDIKVFLKEVKEEAPTYTADGAGYWIKADGTAGAWAEGLVWCSIFHNNTQLYLFGGNHPGNAAGGEVMKTKMIIVGSNGGKVEYDITFNVTAPAGS